MKFCYIFYSVVNEKFHDYSLSDGQNINLVNIHEKCSQMDVELVGFRIRIGTIVCYSDFLFCSQFCLCLEGIAHSDQSPVCNWIDSELMTDNSNERV